MINSRDINQLVPEMQELCKQFVAECKKQGIEVLITSTYRDHESQDALYAQGRTKPGNKVTNAKGGQSAHNWRVAFDFCPLKDGKPDWNDLEKFKKCGAIGQKLGMDWGGNFKSIKDLPHFQIANFTFPKVIK